MIHRSGGFIGRRAVPTSAAASGRWHVTELDEAIRGSIWPAGQVSTPADVSGLVLWLDGSDASTLYDATTGGSLVAVDGAVARWEDKSGNSRHFTQSDSARRPARRSSVKNGLGAVGFANDWMTGVYTYGVGSIFVVWNHPTTVVNDTLPGIFGSRTSSSDKVANSSLGFLIMLPSATNIAISPAPASATYLLNGVSPSAVFTTFNVGDAARTSPDRWQRLSATFTPVAGSKSFVVGADPFTASSRLMQDGHVGEIIAYSGTLSASVAAGVEAYLINKWGLA